MACNRETEIIIRFVRLLNYMGLFRIQKFKYFRALNINSLPKGNLAKPLCCGKILSYNN